MTFVELRDFCRGALEETGVSLTEEPVRHLAVFRLAVCGVPAERAEGVLRSLLAANFMGGGTRGARLAVGADGVIVLTQTLPLALLDGETATGLARALAGAARDWRELISGFGAAVARQESADVESRRMAGSCFLRV